jgi:two-component system, OmpR family, response regulator MtrA
LAQNNISEPLSTQKKRILVVDDDEAVLTSTMRVLDKGGFEADTAQTGQEAIEKSKKKHYDAALIDLKLPDMDGIAVLSKADFSSTVKIMLTGYPSLVSGLAAMERGVDAYLHKPVRPEELILLVKSKLGQKK